MKPLFRDIPVVGTFFLKDPAAKLVAEALEPGNAVGLGLDEQNEYDEFAVVVYGQEPNTGGVIRIGYIPKTASAVFYHLGLEKLVAVVTGREKKSPYNALVTIGIEE